MVMRGAKITHEKKLLHVGSYVTFRVISFYKMKSCNVAIDQSRHLLLIMHTTIQTKPQAFSVTPNSVHTHFRQGRTI